MIYPEIILIGFIRNNWISLKSWIDTSTRHILVRTSSTVPQRDRPRSREEEYLYAWQRFYSAAVDSSSTLWKRPEWTKMNTANITTKAWMYQRRATCQRVSLSEKSLFALPPLSSSQFSAHPLAQQKMNQSSYVLILVNSITNPLDTYISSYRHTGGTWFSNRNVSWRDSFSTEQPWNNLDTTIHHPAWQCQTIS